MTRQQATTWADNANAYVADEEEETFTARVSGELLLDELGEVRHGGRGGWTVGSVGWDCSEV